MQGPGRASARSRRWARTVTSRAEDQRGTRSVIAVLAVLAVLGLGACGDDGDGDGLRPTASSAPPSSDPTTTLAPATSTTIIAAPAEAVTDSDAVPDAGGGTPAIPDDVVLRPGIEYGRALIGGREHPTPRTLLLDLYRPRSAPARRPLPVVVVIHGGGFERRTRTDPPIVAICNRLAQAGFAVVSIDYRLRGEGPVPSERVAPLAPVAGTGSFVDAVLAAADDALTALDYLGSEADELGVDTRRIGLMGSSAGGITADHVAYAAPALGIHVPPLRFVASLWGGLLLGAPPTGDGPAALLMSATSPPLWSMHGEQDATVPFQLDADLIDRAAELGIPHEFYRVAGGPHGYGGTGFFTAELDGGDTPIDRLVRFARAHLG